MSSMKEFWTARSLLVFLFTVTESATGCQPGKKLLKSTQMRQRCNFTVKTNDDNHWRSHGGPNPLFGSVPRRPKPVRSWGWGSIY